DVPDRRVASTRYGSPLTSRQTNERCFSTRRPNSHETRRDRRAGSRAGSYSYPVVRRPHATDGDGDRARSRFPGGGGISRSDVRRPAGLSADLGRNRAWTQYFRRRGTTDSTRLRRPARTRCRNATEQHRNATVLPPAHSDGRSASRDRPAGTVVRFGTHFRGG